MNKKITVAKVISPHGIKGEVKIAVYLEDVLNIEKYPLFNAAGDELKVKISNKNKTIIGTTSGDPIIIAKISGVNDRDKSETLRGVEIFTLRENFGDVPDDEFYYVDLIGLDVIDLKSQKIAKVINVFDHGAGGVVEIEFNQKTQQKNYQKIENFPFKNEIFPEINLEEGFVRIDLPEVIIDEDSKGVSS
jgi:16S rRNA processing protein RimM